MMDSDINKTKEIVKRELSNYLGVDTADIDDDSSLTEDLHMKATDLTDFMEILTRMNMETEGIDLTQVETVMDLVEALTDHQ